MRFCQALKYLMQFLLFDQDTSSIHNRALKRKLGCNVDNCLTCSEHNDQICDQCNSTYSNHNGLCEYTKKSSSDNGFFSDDRNFIMIIVFGIVIALGIILCLAW